MGRKRKGRARKAEPSEERAEQAVAEDEEEDGEEGSTANSPPAAAADECQEEEEEAIEGLLEPFSRDELLNLLTEACVRDPALLSRLAASAASDAAHRRLFVHGLGPGTTDAALAAAFAPFGALDECHVVPDRATGRCRGYGFVTFHRSSAARRALTDASKRVGGHPIACQFASLGPAGHPQRRRAHRAINEKHQPAAATPEPAGGRNNGAGAAALPPVQPTEPALTPSNPTQPLLGSNHSAVLMAKGISPATVLLCRNGGPDGAGLLGASPPAIVVPSSSCRSSLSTPNSHSGDVKRSRLCAMAASTPISHSQAEAGQGSGDQLHQA